MRKNTFNNRNDLIEELNDVFKESVRFYQILKTTPNLVDEGDYDAEVSLAREAQEIKSKLNTDDKHAILLPPYNFFISPLTIRYKKLPFSQVIALRQRGVKPGLLTANVVAFNLSKKIIVLHHRSPESHVYPNVLSIPGGGFWPSDGLGHGDGENIINTARREFYEETQQTANINDDTAIVLTEEIQTGAVQVNFLGAITEIEENNDVNWEGSVEFIHFDQLYNILVVREWAPLGKGCVLLWLALGAPGVKNTKFDGLTPQGLYQKYIGKNISLGD